MLFSMLDDIYIYVPCLSYLYLHDADIGVTFVI